MYSLRKTRQIWNAVGGRFFQNAGFFVSITIKVHDVKQDTKVTTEIIMNMKDILKVDFLLAVFVGSFSFGSFI